MSTNDEYITKKLTLYKHKPCTRGYDHNATGYICLGGYDNLDIVDIKPNNTFTNLYTGVPKPNKRVEELTQKQQYYITRPKSSCQNEDAFWASKDELLVLVFIKLSYGKKFDDALIKDLDNISNNTRAYACYGGASEVLLFIKGATYAESQALVHDFSQNSKPLGIKIASTYSVLAVGNAWQTNPNKFEEELFRVTFSFSLKDSAANNGSWQTFANEVTKAIRHKSKPVATSMLGDYDVRLAYSNAKLCDVLKLYTEGNILHWDNGLYKQCVYHSYTRIHTAYSIPKVPAPYTVQPSNQNPLETDYKTLVEMARDWSNLNIHPRDLSLAQTMIAYLEAFKQASISRTTREIAYSLFPRFKLFMELIKKHIEDRLPLVDNDYININDFLMRIYVIITTANVGKQDLFQGQSIDMRLYTTTHKLIRPYVDFANEMREFLLCTDDVCDRKKYEFAFLTDVAAQTTSRLMLTADDFLEGDNIILISVPEKDIYSDYLHMTLGHEVCHYVGKKIRCRQKRSELLTNFLIEAISFVVVRQLSLSGSKINSGLVANEFKLRVKAELQKLRHSKTSEGLQSKSEKKEQYVAFAQFLSSDGWLEAVNYLSDEIWKNKLKDGKGNISKSFEDYKKQESTFEGIRSMLSQSKLIEVERDEYLHFNHQALIDKFIESCSEVQADVINMLTLRPPIKMYLTQLFETQLIEPVVVARISAVLIALSNSKDAEVRAYVENGIEDVINSMKKHKNAEPEPNPLAIRDADYGDHTFAFKPFLEKFCKLPGGPSTAPAPETNADNHNNVTDRWYLGLPTFAGSLKRYAEVCADEYYNAVNLAADKNIEAQRKALQEHFRTVAEAENIIEAIYKLSQK